MIRYTNTRTGETLEFPDSQPALAQHSWWLVEDLGADEAIEAKQQENAGDLDLSKLKRDELNTLAAELGIEDADKLPNAGAVIEAIEAKQQENAG